MAKETSVDKIKWCKLCNGIEVDEKEDKDDICINCRILVEMKQQIEEIQRIDAQLKPLHEKYFREFSNEESYFSKEGKKASLQFLKESKLPLKRQKELLKCLYKNAKILKEINIEQR